MKRMKKALIVVGVLLLAVFVTTAIQVEDWSRDLSTNFAATSAESDDPLLRTLVLSASPEAVAEAIEAFSTDTSLWNVEKKEEQNGGYLLTMTHSTRVIGFIDDVQVFIEPLDDGAQVDLSSQSRVGKGDLGQNPRNIREITSMLLKSFEKQE